MAKISWTGAAGDGNFNNPANWSPAQVPTSSDTVTIAPSTASIINISQADAVQSLSDSNNVTLSINDNSSLTVGNPSTKSTTLANAGVIELNGNNYFTGLIVNSPTLTLSGTGTIAMGNNGNNTITADAATDVLNNTGNIIEGAGSIGGGTLTFINGASGIVDATQGSALYLNTGTIAISNAGLLEATAGGGLVIQSNVNNSTSAHVFASGANVVLESGVDIAGGTLSSSGASAIYIGNSATLDGTGSAGITNSGTVVVQDNTTLGLLGGVVNSGVIELAGANYSTNLIIGPTGMKAGTVTLTGNGTILLGDNPNNHITGAMAGDALINQNNVIEGSGQLGEGTLTLTNDGTIDATGGNALVVNTSVAITNNALMEATGTGGLVLQTVVNDSGGGTILASGQNAYLNGGTLEGGTIMSTGGASLYVSFGNTGTLDGTAQTVTNDGLINVNDNSTLSLLGTLTNVGTVALNGGNYSTNLVVSSAAVTLTGSGTVLLGDNPNNHITGATAGDALVNLNNTIEGAGSLGQGTLTITNHGTIDATGNNALTVNTDGALINDALMEATGTGGLVLQTVVDDIGGGTILASGQDVYLNGGTLEGGTIKTTGSASLYVSFGNVGTLDGTTQTVTNDGLIAINDDGTLTLLGTTTNAGTIAVNSANYSTDLIIDTATVTLTGGGTVLLDDNTDNRIYGATGSDTLVNTNNLIEGAGQFGVGQLTFTNASAGVVDANVSGQLIMNTGSTITNAGLLEAASGSGGLVIQSNVNNGSAGRISAAGGNVYLASGADIIGGTLSTSGTGTILDSNSATLGAAGGKLTSTGTVVLQDNTTLTLLGTQYNKGEIASNADNYNTDIVIGPAAAIGTVTLNGSGMIQLDDAGNNRIYGGFAGDELVNLNNTIIGAGQIGVGVGANTLNLINDATISASGNNRLTINTGTVVTNNALINSLGAGGLYLDGTINSSGGGTILAATGNVYLSNVTLSGGLVASETGAAVYDVNQATLDGSTHTLTNSGTVNLDDDTTLTLLGTINNTGTIALNADNYNTDLVVGGATVTLTGGGTVLLDNNNLNRIYGAVATDILVNVNNTIEGAGQLGTSQLTLVNDAAGVINANDSDGLALTGGGTAVVNSGLIESTSTGGLYIETAVNSSTGGTILANGGDVYLNGGTIQGGLLATGASGGGYFIQGGSSVLDGTAQAVTNASVVTLTDGTTLTLLGTIVNTGSIDISAANYTTDLIVGGATVTLSGGGTILLDNNSGNQIYGTVGTDQLVNVNNLIEGAGQLGAAQLTFINEAAGIVDANDTGALTVNGGGVVVINDGLMESTSTGGLVFQSAVDSHGGGTILANGGNVYLSGGTLQGGVIQTEAGGAVIVSGTGTLDGSAHTLTNDGLFEVNDGDTLTVLGTIANNGTIAIDNANYNSDMILNSPTVTLTGTGTIALGTGSGNRIYGASAADVLDNVGNTIEGSGQLGAGQLTLINAGTIAQTGSNALTINLNSTGLNTATGLMVAEGPGGLLFQNGTYTNLGTIQADNGSNVTFQSSASLTNDNASGTLTGGTYAALDTGNDATLSITGTAVTTLDATIDLSGASSTILFGGVDIETSLNTISSGGTLDLLNDRDFMAQSNGGTFTDNGVINLGGGTITASLLKIGSGADFNGFGEIDGRVLNNGLIDIEGGQLIINGKVTGTGSITTGTGGVVVLMGGGSLDNAPTGTGTLELKGGSYTLTGSLTIANLDVTPNATVTGTGTIASATVDAGLIMATGGILDLAGAVSGGGTLSAASNSILEANGGGTFNGTITGPGEVLIGHAITLGGSASLSASNLVETAEIKLTATQLTNLAGNTYTIMAPGKDDSRHRASIEVRGTGGATFTNAGMLAAETDTLFKVAFANTGMVAISGGTTTFADAISGAGTYAVASGAIMDAAGGGTIAAALTGAGEVEFTKAATLASGASLAVASVIDSTILTLAANEAVTNLAGNSFTLADPGADAQLPPHRASIEVKGGGGSSFANAGTFLSTASSASVGLSFINSGAVSASAGTLSFLAAATNNGSVAATGATISFTDAVSGTGSLDIGAGGTIALLAGADAGQTAVFQATTGLLALTNPLDFLGTIDDFGGSDKIDLVKTKETSYSFANGILTVENGSNTVASLQFGGSYTMADFALVSDKHGGTFITFK